MPDTLSDFLLARIAEDEAPTYELVPYDCEPGCCAPAGWVGHRCLLCGDAATYGGTVEAITAIAREHEESIHRRARVLAECEAKRQLIRMYQAHDHAAYADHKWSGFAGGYATATDHMLAALALPYADHPEYRDEWSPDA